MNLADAVADFVKELSRLNVELNGEAPSETVDPAPAMIGTNLAYVVAEVARMLRESAETTGSAVAREAAWRVETAWLAVLAGDIDDVEQHVAAEAAAR